MAKVFDATLNTLIDAHVADWAAFLAGRVGVPLGPVTSLDTDLSATLQADRLFRIDGPTPAVLHLELESTGRLGIPGELLRYNVTAWGSLDLPVHSVLVVLRPKANATDQTGQFDLSDVSGQPYLTFRYAVVRVWQESVAGLLGAGLGLAPLAMLTNEAAADLKAAFTRLQDRLRTSSVPDNVKHGLLGSTFVLCGLRYDRNQIEEVYKNMALTLEDSTTYQLILERGVARGEQQVILRLGTKRFGPPAPEVEATIRATTDPQRLERLTERVLDATSWAELLATL
jgi:hypothetical protein